MDQERNLETKRLREAMDSTRASISDTVDALRDRVDDATNWRWYVDRYPGAAVAAAACLGLVLGRWLGGMTIDNGSREYAPTAGASATSSRIDRAAALLPLQASWTRAGSRLETIVSRAIDELGDTIERAAIPILVAKLEGIIGRRSPRP